MEIWDAYDQYGFITGLTLNRDQNIPQGLFHLVVDVILFHEDGDVLMMKRHPKRKLFLLISKPPLADLPLKEKMLSKLF